MEPAGQYVEKKLRASKSLKILFDAERAKTEIARMVRLAREKAGMSQRELAKKAMTTQAVVARLESGNDARMPSLELISRLLSAAGAELELSCKFSKAV